MDRVKFKASHDGHRVLLDGVRVGLLVRAASPFTRTLRHLPVGGWSLVECDELAGWWSSLRSASDELNADPSLLQDVCADCGHADCYPCRGLAASRESLL